MNSHIPKRVLELCGMTPESSRPLILALHVLEFHSDPITASPVSAFEVLFLFPEIEWDIKLYISASIISIFDPETLYNRKLFKVLFRFFIALVKCKRFDSNLRLSCSSSIRSLKTKQEQQLIRGSWQETTI